MLTVVSPVVEMAEAEVKRLSRKGTGVVSKMGRQSNSQPIIVYKKKPHTRFIWGEVLI